MLGKEEKGELIGQFKAHEADTGSPEVQVAILTEKISRLTEHLKINIHDHNSRRGLLQMIGRRRRHLNYLSRQNAQRYQALIARLGLRR